jgi:acetolactate synthase-1/2/3 large subunit
VNANFPKEHPLHGGFSVERHLDEADLVLLVACRAPWYPPSKRPARGPIVAISDNPLKQHMVYQSLQAERYLEGDIAATLRRLTAALTGLDTPAHEERRRRWASRHEEAAERRRGREAEARAKRPIDPVWLCAALGEALPADTIYIDETITHSGLVQEHVPWSDPQAYFYVQGGLGQGLGVALGAKLAAPQRPVVLLIGDGGLLYNPIIQALGASRNYDLPILVVVFNNGKYASMKANHLRFYPDGAAVGTGVFHGVELPHSPDFAAMPALFDGEGEKVEDPEAIVPALKRGLKAVRRGQTAFVNVMLAR